MDRFDELWKLSEMNRRQLIAAGTATGFVTGFAMSTQPVHAQTLIVTDTTGIDAKAETYPSGGTPILSIAPIPRKAAVRSR